MAPEMNATTHQTQPKPQGPVLVTGATGKTGSRIVAGLAELQVPVRRGSRTAEVPFDWQRPETWEAALAGMSSVYISYFPDLAAPGATAVIEAFTRMAARAGVGRLVLLSGRGEKHAGAAEAIVRASGLEWTLVRAAWFAQNFSEGQLLAPALDGVVALPAGRVREAIVDVDDIADVAVAALTGEGHQGQLYEVTGPELLSFDEIAAQLSTAIGREVRYLNLSTDAFRAALVPEVGEAMAELITMIARETLDGRNEWLGDGVQRALGREPRSFADFCRRAAEAGVWRKAA